MTMKKLPVLLCAILLLIPSNLGVLGFVAPGPKALALSRDGKQSAPALFSTIDNGCHKDGVSTSNDIVSLIHANKWAIPSAMVLTTALPAEAAEVVPTAFWAYAHYLSIIVISACLAAERTLVKADMTVEDENIIVKLDLAYGLMAALLIGSGFARATEYGKGGDYYIHEILFWVKMSMSGVWGGLSLFPSLTFYKRNFARKNDETVLPVSEKLAARLQQIINAEISAIFTIPLLATLMSRGVWYWQDFPWPVGLVTAIAATGGSFYFYANQALTWTEDDVEVLMEEQSKQ